MLNIESIIEEIARFLQIDAAEVRRINLYSGKRNLTPYRQKVDDEVLPDLFGKLLASSRYSSRRKKLAEFHGLAVTPMKFGISFTAKLLNQASSLVSLHVDGSVQVSTGAVEMGQGVQTKIRQVVADAFGLKPALVEVMITSTEKNPNTSPTAASSGSDLNGSAALLACEKIKARINEVLLRGVFKKQRSEIVYQRGLILCGKQKIDFKEAVNRAYAARVSLSEQGYYATPNLGFDPVTRRGRAFAYYTQGAAVAEVRINRWTGETRCIRSDVLIDIGASLNPGIDLGQIKGGFAQGMGWLTTEDIRYNDQGALLSSSPTTYKVPHVEDIPSDWNIRLYENRNEIPNLHRSKAVGEPPLMLAISVWCAIKDALREYKDVHTLRAPATAEEILRVIEGGLK
jgi:xanthine dehydrogenase large subunit